MRSRPCAGRRDGPRQAPIERQVTATDDLAYLVELNHLTLACLLIAQHRAHGDAHSAEDAVALLERILSNARTAVAAQAGRRLPLRRPLRTQPVVS